ncbi:TetR/AcrR family transcriptional regulator [Rhodococcus sp. JVH1]|uniref:TetR/AcrR family transcriptional regulator n=1 Tax=Rhodococcus sp. JVH1 TaxID=745408 RepID=UPI000272270B|nr:TetR/AcrR family transcriptional regulator [Rhodococcus sp. JVH1]EJI95654.1 transcriptional regulator, TetR family [Rhodococcus sp. JVH1]
MTDSVRSGNRQEERSGLSTRRLLKSTAQLIAEVGYDRTTLTEIGKRAGYSHGLVSRRFGSKSALVETLIEKLSERFGHEQLPGTLLHATGVDALLAVLDEIQKDSANSPESLRGFYALLFEGLKPIPELHTFVADLHARYVAGLTRQVAAGRQTGRLRQGVDPAEITELTVNALRGLAYRWLLDEDRVDFNCGLDSLARQLVHLAAPPEDRRDGR